MFFGFFGMKGKMLFGDGIGWVLIVIVAWFCEVIWILFMFFLWDLLRVWINVLVGLI